MVALLHFGWRVASQILLRQSPLRFACAVAATLMREGFKVKVGTWIGKRKQKSKSKLLYGVGLTLKKTIKWAKGEKTKASPFDEVHDDIALEAGMKYKELAERRLKVARVSYESAAMELKAAELGMKDAERYVKSLKSHCRNVRKQTQSSADAADDVVFVEHERQTEHGEMIQS